MSYYYFVFLSKGKKSGEDKVAARKRDICCINVLNVQPIEFAMLGADVCDVTKGEVSNKAKYMNIKNLKPRGKRIFYFACLWLMRGKKRKWTAGGTA